jgi:osmotically-inducible protein OsmY
MNREERMEQQSQRPQQDQRRPGGEHWQHQGQHQRQGEPPDGSQGRGEAGYVGDQSQQAGGRPQHGGAAPQQGQGGWGQGGGYAASSGWTETGGHYGGGTHGGQGGQSGTGHSSGGYGAQGSGGQGYGGYGPFGYGPGTVPPYGGQGYGQQGFGRPQEQSPSSPGYGQQQQQHGPHGYGGANYGSEAYAGWAGPEALRQEGRSGRPHHRTPVPRERKGPKGYTRSDQRLLEEICDRLVQQVDIDPSDIEVKVSEGMVELEGSIDSRASKHRVEDLVDSVWGVKDIRNNLRVVRPGPGGSQRAGVYDDHGPQDPGPSGRSSF